MSLLTDIKNYLFQRKLTAESTGPIPKKSGAAPVNLAGAKNVLLLFPADRSEDRKVAEKWKEATRNGQRQVHLVGYFSKDVGTANYDFPAITIKANNWYGVPQGEVVERYLKEHCDLLIRIGPSTHKIMDYLAAIKKSDLKVGPFHAESSPFYQLQFDGRANTDLKDQLAAIETIFSFTNAKPA